MADLRGMGHAVQRANRAVVTASNARYKRRAACAADKIVRLRNEAAKRLAHDHQESAP